MSKRSLLYSSNVQHKKSEIDRFIMNHHRIGMDGGIGIMYIHTLCANVGNLFAKNISYKVHKQQLFFHSTYFLSE